MAEETTKIVRMQQRRGQKQDLPKPLRPGELGFATDSRQLYIGADTTDPVSDIYNKTGIFEKTASAQSITASLANIQMVKFTVPHKIYDKGEFDGVANVVSWTPATVVASSGTTVGREGKVFGNINAGASFVNNITGSAFVPTDLQVVKNGTVTVPSKVASISSGEDYFFEQSATGQSVSTHSHTLTFRSPPSGADAVSISYYSNAAVINAVTSANIGLTSQPGFYASKGITSYRELDNNNIRVAEGIGIGFIGMQFKHIQVATDVKYAPNSADFSQTLGTLLLTKNDTVRENVTAVATASDITLSANILAGSYSLDSNEDYDPNGVYNHTYIKGGTDWLADGKVLSISDYDLSSGEVTATIPSNAASLTRQVTGADAGVGSKLRITVENVENTQIVDSVKFIDLSGTNVSGLDGTVVNVDTAIGAGAVSTVSKTISLDIAFNSAMATDPANLVYITYKNKDASNVVVSSERHGNPVGGSVTLTNNEAANPTGTKTVAAVTDNTFILNTGSNITGNVTNLTFTPVISSATVEATPVVSMNLASASTPADVQTLVNGANLWPRINSIPGAADKMYITHAEAVQKTPFTFALHEDTSSTVTALGLRADEYDRPTATVKAKLEDWLNETLNDPTVNIFKDVYINAEFNSTATGGNPVFTDWPLNLNSSIGEMNFEERTEARDFAKILNNLYFESTNPDIRGLMNIKTNIEFLTAEALAAGQATTDFPTPEQLTLPTGTNNPVNELDISMSPGEGQLNTVFVEYAMHATTSSGNYRRVGTLMYSGDTTINDVVLTDNYTDARSGTLTGNVDFVGGVTGTTGFIKTNNTLSPACSVQVRYIARRWPD